MAKLIRHLGESPPHELVFGTESIAEGEEDEQENERANEVEGKAHDNLCIHSLATSLKRASSLDSPLLLRGPMIAREDGDARWIKEVGSSRWVVEDYRNVVQTLREL